MIAAFFDSVDRVGNDSNSTAAAFRYLLGPLDHEGTRRYRVPVILCGNPRLVTNLVRTMSGVHRYTSSVLAFTEPMETVAPNLSSILWSYRTLLAPRYDPTSLAVAAILHEKSAPELAGVKLRTEVHVICANLDLATGLVWYPYVHSRDAGIVGAWEGLINRRFGFSNPALRPTVLLRPQHRQSTAERAVRRDVQALLEDRHKAGRLQSPDDTQAALTELGLIRLRQLARSVVVSCDALKQPIVLTGAAFESAFGLRSKSQKQKFAEMPESELLRHFTRWTDQRRQFQIGQLTRDRKRPSVPNFSFYDESQPRQQALGIPSGSDERPKQPDHKLGEIRCVLEAVDRNARAIHSAVARLRAGCGDATELIGGKIGPARLRFAQAVGDIAQHTVSAGQSGARSGANQKLQPLNSNRADERAGVAQTRYHEKHGAFATTRSHVVRCREAHRRSELQVIAQAVERCRRFANDERTLDLLEKAIHRSNTRTASKIDLGGFYGQTFTPSLFLWIVATERSSIGEECARKLKLLRGKDWLSLRRESPLDRHMTPSENPKVTLEIS